ncbi:MAG TPA: sulfatase [Polyangiales bacterium]|nr:sulfatase [Polyangiales bacterium]
MRIVFVDIDTLRADHLGCYGYGRSTTPNLDRLAQDSVLFERCYASDVPCLPSRTALFSGRFGTSTGVVSHGGTAADPIVEGVGRGFFSSLGKTAWPALMRKQGLRTASISSFAARHSAHHFCAGLDELISPGKLGLENADEVCALAIDWIERHRDVPAWFLHVQLWDPHTPYRAPDTFGEPFASAALPDWLSDAVRARHFAGCGPHSAQEAVGFSTDYPYGVYPRQPRSMSSMHEVRAMFDGYDTGVRFADEQLGKLFARLRELGLDDQTAIVVSSDHGETLGELNVYGDHHTADEHTAHVPCLVRWPGLGPRRFQSLCYQVDVAATVIDLLGGSIPPTWDGSSMANALRNAADVARSELVITQGAWTCQRAVRWDRWLAISTLHDGYHDYPAWMLFDVERDPHEQHDLAQDESELVQLAASKLEQWQAAAVRRNPSGADPLQTVLSEGGPWHTRGRLAAYLERLRATDRAQLAERLAAAHAGELTA